MYLLRRRTFQRLSRLGIDYYDRETPGRVAAKVVFDLDKISEFLERGVAQIAIALFLLVLASTTIAIWNASVAVVLLVFLPALIAVTIIQAPIADKAYGRQRQAVDEVVDRFQEDLIARHTLHAYGAKQRAADQFERKAWELRQARRWSAVVSNVYIEVIQLIQAVATAYLLSRAGNLALTAVISVGSVVSLQFLLRAALAPIPLLSNALQVYLQARASFRTLAEPYLAPIMPIEKPTAMSVPRLDGAVSFAGVDFTYPGTSRPVLQQVDFEVPAGTQVALVGRTGAGKSSLAKLIARIYDPDAGAVSVDGMDLRDLRLVDYRRRLGIVPQDDFCFRGTVLSNLAYGRPDAIRTEIEDAARRIGALDSLLSIAGGLDGRVEEEGRNLTAGQRQLIGLTRVMLVDPDVLVLDEATASLDEELEATVLAALRDMHRTVIFVTHRLSVVRQADLVAVVDGGRVAEVGTHDELLAGPSLYRQIWSSGIDVPRRVRKPRQPRQTVT